MLLVILLTATGRSTRLQTFVLAFQISALISVSISALLPAIGAYPHLHIDPALDHPAFALTTMNLHVDTLLQLRGEAPVISLSGVEGIVTFPSMHMALAILFVWGFWTSAGIRWAACALNLVVMVSTPLSGGHYFVDLAGGGAVAAFAIWAANTIRRRIETRATRPESAGSITVPSGRLAPITG